MTVFVDTKWRRVLPRWRMSSTALKLGEFDGTHVGEKAADSQLIEEFRGLEEEWVASPTKAEAAELLSLASSAGLHTQNTIAAAQFLLGAGSEVNDVVRDMARAALPSEFRDSPKKELEIKLSISTLKRRVIDSPRDSLAWADLALLYTQAGQLEHAGRAIRVATATSPTNRYILRSAARFHTHAGRPDRAVQLLAQGNQADPWLASALIAVRSVAGEKQQGIRAARSLVDARLSPLSTSELAASLATLELEAGAIRNSRALFQNSLREPTENTCAQVAWAHGREHSVPQPVLAQSETRPFEANARLAFSAGVWSEVLQASEAWLQDQPFSVEPAGLGSVAGALDDSLHERAIGLLKEAQRANPGNWLLANNLAFALASHGSWAKAEAELERIDKPPSEIVPVATLTATAGLIAFRRGDTSLGVKYYERACELLANEPVLQTRATFLFWREALIAGLPLAQTLERKATLLRKKIGASADLDALANSVVKLTA